MTKRLPSIDIVLGRLKMQFWTTGEVAAELRRHPTTVRRWRNEGWLVPSVTFVQSKDSGLMIPLYTDDDLRRARRLAPLIKPGPAPGSLYPAKDRARNRAT
jgi:hypothetical protein